MISWYRENTAALLAGFGKNVQCLDILIKIDQVDWNIHNHYGLSASMIAVHWIKLLFFEIWKVCGGGGGGGQ